MDPRKRVTITLYSKEIINPITHGRKYNEGILNEDKILEKLLKD